MPKKTIITKVTLGVEAPDKTVAEARDENGNVLQPRSLGLDHVLPGNPVTLDAAEADAIIARWGGEVVEEIPDEELAADAKPAGKAATRPAAA